MEKEDYINQLREIFMALKKVRVKFVLSVGEYIEESHLESQMFGNPCFEKNEEWPINKDTGKSLEFIFQIINTAATPLPKEIAMIQVYIDPENIPHSETDAGICIKTYANINKDNLVKLKKPYNETKATTVLMNPINTISLPVNEDRPFQVHEIGRKIESIDPAADYFEIIDEIYHELGVDEYDYSGIGGYPHWLQGAETPLTESGKKCDFLFEIHGGFKWNFMVTLLFFINPDNPLDIRFVHQYT